MKKNIVLRLKPLDILIILLVVAGGVFFTVRGTVRKGSRVSVNANGVHYEYSATSNGVYTVAGELGETIFEIKDGRVRIIDSPCPNKTCVAQGWHNPLVCLPNKVMITVEGEGGAGAGAEGGGKFDAISE
jgi:hypothetical protein